MAYRFNSPYCYGHELELLLFRGGGNGESGELYIDVAEGKTVTNNSLLLDGGISLVKDGVGTFVASKQQQTYTGGTTIAAGVLKADAAGKVFPLSVDGSVLTVDAVATFELDGKYDFATFDLTGHSGAWSNRSTANHIGPHFLSVAKDAHVNVDISGRTDLRNGDRVIEWEAAPELVHRWSFNGTYEDSVGGATAEPTGAAITSTGVASFSLLDRIIRRNE